MKSTDFNLGVLVSGRGTNLQSIIDQIEQGKLNARIAIIISSKPEAQALERGKKHGIETAFLDSHLYPEKPGLIWMLLNIIFVLFPNLSYTLEPTIW